jgi:hypothetical protein
MTRDIQMEFDPMETVEQLNDPGESGRKNAGLNMLVAITVALLSTFGGICKVKDDNIVQSMEQAQANKLDHWSFYQARNIREEVAKGTLLQLELAADNAQGAARAGYGEAVTRYQALIAEQAGKKRELEAQAMRDQKDYDSANFRDDQFDLSDAFIAIAVALLAVTSLTQQRWLYAAAMVPALCGIVMGLAGLLGWSVHPSWLVGLFT